MHLVHGIIPYFDRPWEYLNDEQLAARREFSAWRTRMWARTSGAAASGGRQSPGDKRDHDAAMNEPVDGRTLLPTPEMLTLIHCIFTIFFGSPIPRLTFHWSAKRTKGNLGLTRARPLLSFLLAPTISINPHLLTHGRFGPHCPLLNALSTLLHECIHAFLLYRSCPTCLSTPLHDVAAGHGRAFQVLGRKVEEVFPRLLGVPVRLGRTESLMAAWGDVRPVISLCDFRSWGLNGVGRGGGTEEEVRGLVERTDIAHNVLYT
ncbi:hypothetical protein K458DRAFT_410004 [Lentithecium fluviatile CBS 122367]|uniref:SprT-like domain-containing protein n=1 Tax=Lentithecium fluviatile CBS 122367 TaxID=1168545 RepID=A0A6G1IFV2_9PLEO|nr:hypothetical protein K458DRAFT_410004 [Lentithecium fluviatile CBS 122367]